MPLLSLFAGLQDGSPQHARIVPFLCNIDAEAYLHKEAFDLEDRIDIIVKYEALPQHADIFDKEKDDYRFCLQSALKYNPRYVILLEDDVLVVEQFFDIIKIKLNHIISSHGDGYSNWLFMKLYYPQKWQGYGINFYHYMELTGIAISGGSIILMLYCCIVNSSGRKSKHSFNTCLLFVLGASYCVLLCISIGRPYILQLRTLSLHTYGLVRAPGCCTQAMLYPSKMVQKLAEHLPTITATHVFAVDLIIDKYASRNGLFSYLVEPSLVKHIGLVSSLNKKFKPPAEFV